MKKKLLVVLICSVICMLCIIWRISSVNEKRVRQQDDITSEDDRAGIRETEANVAKSDKLTEVASTSTPTPSPLPTATPSPTPIPTPIPTPTEIPVPHKVVVLDPGHGGYDQGAYSDGIVEAEITLKVANYCRDYLLNNYKYIDVYLTREENAHLDRDKVTDLRMRCQMAVDVNADILVSIHFNATDAHALHGSEIYVSKKKTVKQQTFDLGYAIMDELEAIGLTRRHVTIRNSNDTFDENGVAVDYYAINRHCAANDIPGIIVEAAFIDNAKDRSFVDNDNGLRMIGEADAKGIANYLELEPVNPSETDEQVE